MKIIIKDPARLRQVCEYVHNGLDISVTIDELIMLMFQYDGWGLSAPQIGYKYRIFVLRDYGEVPLVFVNPEIKVLKKGNNIDMEGCLSLPGEQARIKRPNRVRVKGLNSFRLPYHRKLSGLLARAACHEMDHLNGILITDYEKGQPLGGLGAPVNEIAD